MNLLATTLALAFADPAAAPAAPTPTPKPAPAVPAQTATADLKGADAKVNGTITLVALPKGFILKGDLSGLPPGEHAIHLHETGICEAPFKTAGGHFNPGKKKHGMLQKAGHHAGDLPNVFVGADGKAKFEVVTMAATLGAGATSVFDKDGTAIVIHAGPDDHMTDPAGNAGDRISCGVIVKATTEAPLAK